MTFDHRDIITYFLILIALVGIIVMYWNANRKVDNEFKKIWNDTLKEKRSNKYSRKSLTMFMCFYFSLFIGSCLVVYNPEHFGTIVFETFFIGGTAITGASIYEKLNNKTANQIENE